MLAKLMPYSATRNSGVPWLGEVPEHWEVCRNGRLFAQRNQTGRPDLPILEVSLKTGVRIRDFENSVRKQVMSDKEKYKCARRGDLAYNMMRMWQGAVGLAPVDGLVSPAYVVAKPLPGTESRYFEFLFRTDAYMAEVNNYSRGIVSDRNRLYWDEFKQIPSPFPPPDEQTAIVRFLDYADRRIRRYIRAKQKLIKLLEEQKQVVIHRAVTRGLDQNVRLKPSGVQWLGEVPEHWDIRKLRLLFRRHGSGTTPNDDTFYGGGTPWVMTGDLTDAGVSETKRTVTKQALVDVSALRLYPPGSLAVAMYGATIGKTGVFEMEACTNQACCVLVDPLPTVNVWFVQAVVLMAKGQLIQQSYGGGQPNINSEIVCSLRVPVPPYIEQDHIVRDIADKAVSLDAASQRASDEISFLREYRTRLIADVVTGKLDVRETAANLPDDADEPEAPDDTDALAEDDIDTAPKEAKA